MTIQSRSLRQSVNESSLHKRVFLTVIGNPKPTRLSRSAEIAKLKRIHVLQSPKPQSQNPSQGLSPSQNPKTNIQDPPPAYPFSQINNVKQQGA